MKYSERYDDRERGQVYAELVHCCAGCYPSGESALVAELLEQRQPRETRRTPRTSPIAWSRLLQWPVLSLRSLTRDT
jgi:hypothetical protein